MSRPPSAAAIHRSGQVASLRWPAIYFFAKEGGGEKSLLGFHEPAGATSQTNAICVNMILDQKQVGTVKFAVEESMADLEL